MGKYWATVNQPEARFGQIAELDDSDPSVQQRVVHGFLIPHDRVAKLAQSNLYSVEAPVTSSKEDIRKAIVAAREAQSPSKSTSKPSVSTAVTKPNKSDESIAGDDD